MIWLALLTVVFAVAATACLARSIYLLDNRVFTPPPALVERARRWRTAGVGLLIVAAIFAVAFFTHAALTAS